MKCGTEGNPILSNQTSDTRTKTAFGLWLKGRADTKVKVISKSDE